MAILPGPLKNWLERKQTLHQQAVDEYCFNIRAALEKELERRIRKSNAKSLTFSFNPNQPEPVRGLALDSASIPGVTEGERVTLVDQSNRKPIAGGFVLAVDSQTVKVKLNKQLDMASFAAEAEQLENWPKFELTFHKGPDLERVQRIGKALDKFKSNSCSLYIQKCLLGNYNDWTNVRYNKSRLIIHPELEPAPKGFQLLAIEQAMKRRVTLIEGVAGSGKTHVAANIACSMSILRNKKILLCSPVPSTVRQLVEIIERAGNIKLVQLGDQCGASGQHQLESLIEEAIYNRAWARTENSRGLRLPKDPLVSRIASEKAVKNCSKWLMRKVEGDILAAADVVCCTLDQADRKCLRKLNFHMLIIDDAHLTSEAECLVAMMTKGLQQVTLLSEMRRKIRLARSSFSLPLARSRRGSSVKSNRPTLRRGNSLSSSRRLNNKRILVRRSSDTKYPEENDLRQVSHKKQHAPFALGGLFERLLALGLSSVALKTQFRMHETLAEFPKYHFYMSRLKTDPEVNQQLTNRLANIASTADDDSANSRFSWLPSRGCLTAIFNTKNNDTTNAIVLDIINKLVRRENLETSQIGIITNIPSSQAFDGVRVGTIENSLEERDFIILMFHCPNNKTISVNQDKVSEPKIDSGSEELIEGGSFELNCNYLQNNNSLNIAITRARLGLFIIGNLDVSLEKHEEENHYQPDENNKPQQGPINNKFYSNSWLALVKYYQTNKLIA